MHDLEFSKRLFDLQKYKNLGRGLSTARNICSAIDDGTINIARAEYTINGDKLDSYPDIIEFIENHLGCRLHGKINCKDWLCATLKTIRQKRLGLS